MALGTERLYRAIGRRTYCFQPVSVTHSCRVISQIENFVAINSAMEVDLLGQAYAEMGPYGPLSDLEAQATILGLLERRAGRELLRWQPRPRVMPSAASSCLAQELEPYR